MDFSHPTLGRKLEGQCSGTHRRGWGRTGRIFPGPGSQSGRRTPFYSHDTFMTDLSGSTSISGATRGEVLGTLTRVWLRYIINKPI